MGSMCKSNRGSMTIEAAFVVVIIVIIIFSLLYLIFYSMDEVKMKCLFIYDVMNYREENEKSGMTSVQSIFKSESEFDLYEKENFKKGILTKKINAITLKKGINADLYSAKIDVISQFPLVNNFLSYGDRCMNIGVRFDKENACETIRMYQALIVKE